MPPSIQSTPLCAPMLCTQLSQRAGHMKRPPVYPPLPSGQGTPRARAVPLRLYPWGPAQGKHTAGTAVCQKTSCRVDLESQVGLPWAAALRLTPVATTDT